MPFQNHLSKQCGDSLVLTPGTEDDISGILSEFNNSKSCKY